MILSTAVGAFFGIGYGRGAYANGGICTNTGGSNIVCTGTTGVAQTVNTPNADVTVGPGGLYISVSTPTVDAFTLIANGDVSFDDTGQTVTTSFIGGPNADNGMRVTTGYMSTPGVVSITSNGRVSAGERGIYVSDTNNSSFNITVNGAVYGDDFAGISLASTSDFTAVAASSITVGATGEAYGGRYGIIANTGESDLNISVFGEAYGYDNAGIKATGSRAGDITITTGEASTVFGGYDGIDVFNGAFPGGGGDITVTVSGLVTGGEGAGIFAHTQPGFVFNPAGAGPNGNVGIAAMDAPNDSAGPAVGDVTITVEATAAVYGGTTGILATSEGGNITITADGTVGGAGTASPDLYSGVGIYAGSFGAGDITITTSAGSGVTGTVHGIFAYQGTDTDDYGSITGQSSLMSSQPLVSGSIEIIAGGLVGAGSGAGIRADINNTNINTSDLTITTLAGSQVGGTQGIWATRSDYGALVVNVNGSVAGLNGAAILTHTQGSTHEINIGSTGLVAGTTGTVNSLTPHLAIEATGTRVIIENEGTISGFVNLTDNNDRFTNAAGGTWMAAGMDSSFGEESAPGDLDIFYNSGTLVAASNLAWEITRLEDLELFVSNAGGLITMSDEAGGDVLRVDGNFQTDGGVIAIDTMLDGDASETDRLIVLGSVSGSGTTGILVNVIGGAGAETPNGIEVVTVHGTSEADSFALANTTPLEVGAFVYTLSRGDCTNQADQDWYLCSTEQIGANATVTEAVPNTLLSNFGSFDPLNQRVGDRRGGGGGGNTAATRDGVNGALGYAPEVASQNVNQAFSSLNPRHAYGTWARVWGGFLNLRPGKNTSGASVEATNWGVQAGFDMPLGDGTYGDFVLGVSARYGVVNSKTSNAVGTGSIRNDGFGIGATFTWYAHNGFYFDGQATVNWVSSDASSSTAGLLYRDKQDVVWGASAEIGKRHALADGFNLVPQAQVWVGYLSGSSFTDVPGNAITISNAFAVKGRVGLAVEREFSVDSGRSGNVFGIVNVLHDFSDDRVVTIAGTVLRQSGEGTWAEFGAGVNLPVGTNANLYARGNFRQALAVAKGQAFDFTLGARINW